MGVTFKPGTDDLREAPSIPNVRLLLNEGAKVHVYDPVGEKNFQKIHPTEVEFTTSIEEALKDADLCFVFTEWPEIKNMPVTKFAENMKTPYVYDGRNCYSLHAAEKAGIHYRSIGRPAVNEKVLQNS